MVVKFINITTIVVTFNTTVNVVKFNNETSNYCHGIMLCSCY